MSKFPHALRTDSSPRARRSLRSADDRLGSPDAARHGGRSRTGLRAIADASTIRIGRGYELFLR